MKNKISDRMVALLQFLYQKTDDDHSVTISDIIHYLKEKGISAVRQTIYADLKTLQEAGVDIITVKSTQNRYFIGGRLFQDPELKLLVDAVASSKIISPLKTEELVQKICRLTSESKAMQLQQLAALSGRIKPNNERIYYIIDSLHNAIASRQQIRFQYYEYTATKERVLKHDGAFYTLDPYTSVWKNDHYYLIGFSHKHQQIAHFRIDRLAGVEILDTHFQENTNFDMPKYMNRIVDMYSNNRVVNVELLCENDLMKVIIDNYGEEVPVRKHDEKHFIASIQVDPSGTFYGWVFKFMGRIRIINPQECLDEMSRISELFLLPKGIR